MISALENILSGLIYDRTQADVDYALSLQNNSEHTDENLRGAYNVSDRVRVGSAINWLIAALKLIGFHARDNWGAYDIVKVEDNANTLACLRVVQIFLPFGKSISPPADLDSLSYQKANAVERVLYETGSAYLWIAENTLFAGESYASNFYAPISKFI